jgi:molybdopterin biosynthesis enzyme
MQGLGKDAALREEHAVLAREVKGSIERASYFPATLHTNAAGYLVAEPLRWGGSSDFVAFTRATALLIVPEGIKSMNAGDVATIVRLP